MSASTFAQNALNASSPEELRKMRAERINKLHINGKDTIVSTKATVLPYGFIEDKDVQWSKVVWEIIDLNEKLNQPYYHSSDGLVNSNLSLYDALFEGMRSGKIKEVYADEYFTTRLTQTEINSRLEVTRDSDALLDKINAGEKVTAQDSLELRDTYKTDTKTVKLVKIKGMWYIDKRLGQMKYRLLGIAPMGPDPQTMGLNVAGVDYSGEMIDLFWVWYPDAREVLANYTVFNPKNNSSPITYDDMLNARRFSSIIYKSESGYGDGKIDEYLPKDSRAQLEESNRIKASVLQQENDMWNY